MEATPVTHLIVFRKRTTNHDTNQYSSLRIPFPNLRTLQPIVQYGNFILSISHLRALINRFLSLLSQARITSSKFMPRPPHLYFKDYTEVPHLILNFFLGGQKPVTSYHGFSKEIEIP